MGQGEISARQSISRYDTGRDWAEGDTGLALTGGEGGGVSHGLSHQLYQPQFFFLSSRVPPGISVLATNYEIPARGLPQEYFLRGAG